MNFFVAIVVKKSTFTILCSFLKVLPFDVRPADVNLGAEAPIVQDLSRFISRTCSAMTQQQRGMCALSLHLLVLQF